MNLRHLVIMASFGYDHSCVINTWSTVSNFLLI